MNPEQIRICLALLALPGMGPARLSRLLLAAGSVEGALYLDGPGLNGLGLPQHTIDAYAQLAPESSRELESILSIIEQHRLQPVSLLEEQYPRLLREIADPPPILFIRGNASAIHGPQVAIVGSRRPSPGGRRVAREMASRLIEYGLGVTSGLATGIDSESHQGAVLAGGTTIAVLGTGAERIYPASNRQLAHAIIEHGGALLSEFLPGTAPEAHNFPRRNRLISGLSLGVVVVEAALRSGSLVTARLAAEQNREVMAVPGSVLNPLARGCHVLLRNGAALVEQAEDVLLALGDRFELTRTPRPANAVPQSTAHGLTQQQRNVLEAIGYEETPLESILICTGLDAGSAAAATVVLELQGLVRAVPGGYLRCRSRQGSTVA